MTKAEIVSQIAEKTGVEKQIVLTVVEGFMDQVRNSLYRWRTCLSSGLRNICIKAAGRKKQRVTFQLIRRLSYQHTRFPHSSLQKGFPRKLNNTVERIIVYLILTFFIASIYSGSVL